MDQRFLILDVFSEQAFGGNQLGVFPDARGLSAGAMQALARELNFAESTFVLPAEDGRCDRRVRIFTPKVELPFAGHPTLGTAAALVHEGLTPWQGAGASVVLDEKAGPVEVRVERRGNALFSEMVLRRPLDRPAEVPHRSAVAASLSLPEGDVSDAWFAGLGVPFCFVELADRHAVDRAALDRQAWKSRFAKAWSPHLFCFAAGPPEGSRIYARMFAPGLGVDEDPATGSASAALVASLAERRGGEGSSAALALEIEQGVAMGRPSRIHASVEPRPGGAPIVRVGGSCSVVASGNFVVPDDASCGRELEAWATAS